jgi:EmrB/QacA subfamily drug resistance transporter
MIAALARGRAPAERGSGSPATMLAALSLASFLVVFDDSAVAVALPSLQRDLHLDMSELEWTLNAYTLGLATVLLIAGKLVDRFGARRALVFGLALFTLASIPAAFADGGAVLIAARAVQGMGAAFVAPASLAAISALFPATRRGAAIGVWAGISAIGLGTGPLLGAVIVEYVGWSGVFLLNLPLGALLIGVAVTGSTTTPLKPARGRLDIAGAAAAGAALLFGLLALTRGNSDGWLSPVVVGLAFGAIAAIALFVAIEARAVDPVVPLTVFRSRPLVGASVIGLLSTAAMCSLFFFMSLYLQSVAGYSVLATGAAFLPMTLVIAVGSPLAGIAGGRITARTLAGTGMALLSVAMLLLSQLDDGLGIAGIVLGLSLAGLGIAMTATPVTTVALAELPSSRQGLAGALISEARTIGLALGVALMGALLGAATGEQMTSRLSLGLKVNAAVAAVGAVAAVLFLHPGSRAARGVPGCAARGVAGLRPAPGEAEGRG